MKPVIYAVVAASIFGAPLASFAQSINGPLTRQQVRDELVQLQKAGYKQNKPHDTDYPARLQAALARVDAQRAAAQSNMNGS